MDRRPTEVTRRARELRAEAIPSERRLWQALRLLKAKGIHIRRQHPVLGFYLDFYCAKARLALELDGTSHDQSGDYDDGRDAALAWAGIEVVRLKADEVIFDPEGVASWFGDLCLERIHK